MKNTIKKYHAICKEIVEKFSEKQNLDFDFWVGDDIGGVASFSCSYFFSLQDMVLDLETQQIPGFIIQWQEESTDFNLMKEDPIFINYISYIGGMRYGKINHKT